MNKTLERAKARLVIDWPFYAVPLFSTPITLTRSVPTAAMDAKGRMYVNRDYIEALPINQVTNLLVHELDHKLFGHARRLAGRDPKLWNTAADAVINARIRAEWRRKGRSGLALPEGGVDIPVGDESVEQVYRRLQQEPPPEGDPDPWGDDLIPGDGEADPTNPRPLTPEEAEEADAARKALLAQTLTAAKLRGTDGGDLARLAEAELNPPTPWWELLHKWATEMAKQDYSWSRPNRRFVHQGLYLPSLASQATMGPMVVALDVSGSVSQQVFDEFAGHLNAILEAVTPEMVYVVACDTEVNSTEEFTPDDFPVRLAAVGGGGTDFRPVFDWVEEHIQTPACLVYLTDGWGPAPETAPGYPVLWATTDTDQYFLWGEVIKV